MRNFIKGNTYWDNLAQELLRSETMTTLTEVQKHQAKTLPTYILVEELKKRENCIHKSFINPDEFISLVKLNATFERINRLDYAGAVTVLVVED
jgi:hypothetical protein